MIFVDTSFFAALLLPKDANHSRAVQAIEGPAFGASDHVSAPPFESLRLPLDSMFPSG